MGDCLIDDFYMINIARWFPIIDQFSNYSREKCLSDVLAAAVVTVMLIPQSLAYAILAGLPPHYGLYASIIPIVVYAVLGTSTSLAIGPVAIASIMTASALSSITSTGLATYIEGAVTLAVLSGALLLLMGFLRFGFVVNFLSHSVVSGFITASALIIALGQLRHLLGVNASGENFIDLGVQIFQAIDNVNTATVIVGVTSLMFLVVARRYGKTLFELCGASENLATSLTRMSPIIAVCCSTAAVAFFSLDKLGVDIVGEIPSGIVDPRFPSLDIKVLKILFVPALFIAIVGYVESISVGRTLGAKRDERIDPNQELIAIGGSNIASGFAGAFPVMGGFSRSVVNFDAGAKTQFAGIFTAIGIAIASILLTPYLFYLPVAMLAATIIVAVLALIDVSIFKYAWNFSKSDFAAILITLLVTLATSVEVGVGTGIILSVLLHLYHTSKPHIAEIGLVPGTEYFRNINHYSVEIIPKTVSLRIDESLLFSNVSYLENYITDILSQRPETRHIVLHCGAINTIDLSGMEMLESLNKRLLLRNIKLHLSEVKTPVKKLLDKVDFISQIGGQLYMTQLQAYQTLLSQQSTNNQSS